jgi:hypothetical protein
MTTDSELINAALIIRFSWMLEICYQRGWLHLAELLEQQLLKLVQEIHNG